MIPPSNKFSEKVYRDLLAQELQGDTEFLTPVGRPDVVTTTEVIEVKPCGQWKAALGQVLAYSYYFPGLARRLHLIGSASSDYKALVEKHCQQFDVTVSWADDAIALPKESLTVYLQPDIKEALKQMSEEQQRSMAFLAETAIVEMVKQWQQKQTSETDPTP